VGDGYLWNLYTYSMLLRLTHKTLTLVALTHGTFEKTRSAGCFLTEIPETELGVSLNGVQVI
jgi:hypothetical protein